MKKTTRATVADLLAEKGKRQLVQIFCATPDEAAAAHAAGIDIIGTEEQFVTPAFREAAGSAFITAGLIYGAHVNADEYIRAGFKAMNAGADAVYSASSVEIIARMYAEGLPVVGHVGLIPSRRTWTGGFKAVGKTAETALRVYEATKRLEAAGAIAVEMEVVPDRVAAEISKRTTMLVISMGGGPGCDGQYLFSEDILGANEGHYPRHCKRYRDFAAEHRRLQAERTAAFTEFRRDVETGVYPAPEHMVRIEDADFDAFLSDLPRPG
ncbi:MAG TPA: 3-methyl-2-oxobutanoate hydroxymethyltransferase [Stellaceae bacterium]|nr:3-methyl-2-oxobutanoate hydroxymethyltransferase [Stellaceae bacterium]